jgi:hypothetical protein
MKTADEDIRKIEELEDGSSLYEIGDNEEEVKTEDTDFYENLAIGFSDEARKKLSSFLLEAIEQDIEVREQWLTPVEKAKQYLGFSLEDIKNIPFSQATRTFDTTLATALIRFYATARAELLPQDGPAGFKINGNSDEEVERKGELNRDLLNYYLTIEDQSYYSDFERFLLYLGFYGSGFKKVYYDKISKRPLSRFILPTDFVIDADCTSILESNRLTHILHLTKREIILNQQNKIYRDVDLPYLKTMEVNDDDDESKAINKKSDEIDLGAYAKRSLFPIYEVHTYLNLEDFTDSNNDSDQIDIPLPYIVTIDKISKEVLSIRKNWTEEDEEKKREEYFIQYNYLPGFGIYGYGLAHLMGSNAISLTTILRQLIDAGTFKNLPGGLRAKGFKTQTNDIIVGPGQFIEVDTGGIPLSEAFMPLPYSEPSSTLHQLMLEERNQCKELASTSEMGMLDSKEDIPVGTTLAMLETNNRIQSAVLRSIHFSFSRELQLIDKIFRRTIDTKEFNFGSESKVITSNDFVEEVMIIPVSDPSVNSTTQRIIKAEAILKTAQLAPELHNLREVFKLNYEAQGLNIEAIDKILPPPIGEQDIKRLPAIAENINILKGEPVKAYSGQEHDAHMLSHGMFAEEHPDCAPQIAEHNKEHMILKFLQQMQLELGFELPPSLEDLDPQMQNTLDLATAEVLGQRQENVAQQQQAPIDPNALLMADIQQKQAETEAKERIANQKTETDIFRAQLDFEKEKAKIESAEEIAKLKAETDMSKSELDFEKEQAKIVSIEEMAKLKSQTELIKNGGEIDQNY